MLMTEGRLARPSVLGCGGSRQKANHSPFMRCATRPPRSWSTGAQIPLQVMRRMGHSDMRTTYNLYGHLFPDREDELVAKLDSRHARASGPSREPKGRWDPGKRL